jgi:hypothetical protein
MKAITAKCIGCKKSKERLSSWTGTFRVVDVTLLEMIRNQRNINGKRCFPEKDIKIY